MVAFSLPARTSLLRAAAQQSLPMMLIVLLLALLGSWALGQRLRRTLLDLEPADIAALALRLGSDVPPDALVRLVWGEGAPRGAHGTLHSYLSGVRRVLEPGLGPREKPRVLLTSDHGYRLALRDA